MKIFPHARQRLLNGDTSPTVLAAWLRLALPHYNRSEADPHELSRAVLNPEATRWFTRADGEGNHFDLRADLHRITCPVLLMGGTLDPMLPIENQLDIAALLRPEQLQFVEFEGAGHGLVADAPERALKLLKHFITTDFMTTETPA